jgi:hypothetical protein
MTEDNLARSIETAVEEINAEPPQSLPRLKPTLNDASDFDRLLATGERLLRHQQDKLVGEKALYEEARTSLVNGYAAAQAKLERDTADAAHRLLLEHNAKVAQIERTITALKGLRGS